MKKLLVVVGLLAAGAWLGSHWNTIKSEVAHSLNHAADQVKK